MKKNSTGKSKNAPKAEGVAQLSPEADLTPVQYAFRSPVSFDELRQYEAELQKILHLAERDLNEGNFQRQTNAQRKRLRGSGVRRLGFIINTFEAADKNPEFVPPFLDMGNFQNLLNEINATRNITITLQQLLRIYTDTLLIAGDQAYKLSLTYYNSVRDASRRGIPGAQAVFRTLQPFFRRGRRAGEEPTVQEMEREVKALLHGRKEGKIVITGKTAKRTRGKRTVIDDTHRNHSAFHATERGELDE